MIPASVQRTLQQLDDIEVDLRQWAGESNVSRKERQALLQAAKRLNEAAKLITKAAQQ